MIRFCRGRLGRCHVAMEYELADFWVGVFWKRRGYLFARDGDGSWATCHELHVWICLVPCFPIHVIIPRGVES